jgi:YD repeat-containing protein
MEGIVIRFVIDRIIVSLVLVGMLCAPADSQDSCVNRNNPNNWCLSGNAGSLSDGPGGGPTWKQALQQKIASFGGTPSCSYTWIPNLYNPIAGHWYGSCCAPKAGCNAPPLSPCPTCSNGVPVAGAPINLTTGNTYIQQTDVKLPGLGSGLMLARTWNSVWPSSQSALQVGLFGPNWRSTYEERVFPGSGTAVNYMVYARSDGSFWYLGTVDGSTWTLAAPANTTATLTSGSTYWTLTFQNGEQRRFDNASGNLIALLDRNGNTTQVSYDGSNRLITVTDPVSRHLTFGYANGSSRLVTGVTSDVGLSLSYAYDTQGRLTQVTNPDLTTLSFTYNSQSSITAVTDTNGKTLESHTYDTKGRGLTSSRAGGVDAVTITYPQ